MNDQTDLQQSQREFEELVRKTARLLWTQAALQGSTTLDGRERDGVFETRSEINIVEATTSRKRDKAEADAKKTADAVRNLRKTTRKRVHGWVITRDNVEEAQKEATQRFKDSVTIFSLSEFRGLLFDATEYLEQRQKHSFGSVKDHAKDDVFLAPDAYIPLDFYNVNHGRPQNFSEISRAMNKGSKRYLVIGEYGSGKSMSLRQLHFDQASEYRRGASHRFPIYLNLREHQGLTSPIDALEQHARTIGYQHAAVDLVRAWRGGYVDVILDGFDELATAGWGMDLSKVREHRAVSMGLVRAFVKETPRESSIVISGRPNYFDSQREMLSTLDPHDRFETLEVCDLTEPQVDRLLKYNNIHVKAPGWLPARPLLLVYLATKGHLGSKLDADPMAASATAWNALLDGISEREAEQDKRLSQLTVRMLIERLATVARQTTDGLGRLDLSTIHEAFKETVGFTPDAAAQQFILRLPGLTPTSDEDSNRTFIDADLADCARAGDTIRFCQDPHNARLRRLFGNVVCQVGELCQELIADQIGKSIKLGDIKQGIITASTALDNHFICVDLFNALARAELESIDLTVRIYGTGGNLSLYPTSTRLADVEFDSCIFDSVDIASNVSPDDLPTLKDCLIGNLSGIVAIGDLPAKFASSEVTNLVDAVRNTADMASSALPLPTQVLLTILKRLFLQSGGGRQEGAFYRVTLPLSGYPV